MTEENKSASCKDDLSSLLSGALDDFESIPQKKKATPKQKRGVKEQNRALPLQTENDLLEMFTRDNGAGVKEELEKLSKMSEEESEAMIQAKLTETLNQMQINTQASSSQSSEDKLFQNISSNGLPGLDNFDNLLPMMEGMMQSLLSKELLYTPMKDIAEKFPDWLADNRNKVSEEEFIKYNKQFELTKKICFLYEEETTSDSSVKKKKRFDKVMALMQEMQNLGHPPKELVGETPSPMDPAAVPGGMDPNNCPLQ